jgi:hypothetical protein
VGHWASITTAVSAEPIFWFGLPPTAPSAGLECRSYAAPPAWPGPVFPPSPASSSAPRHHLRPLRHCEVDPNVNPAHVLASNASSSSTPLTLQVLEANRSRGKWAPVSHIRVRADPICWFGLPNAAPSLGLECHGPVTPSACSSAVSPPTLATLAAAVD